jgi:hypothetical protein
MIARMDGFDNRVWERVQPRSYSPHLTITTRAASFVNIE